ncbi:hypothetical protein TrispH2_005787 [Trichoplax sp. H2]|uniref:Copper acquisition factor BIM1-like domain-containing protein n=1 Tax=Trichoplax adhaerens TaxID=10228 RepID=B3S475_TRIAD|nr:expressed hypothetical protein [Trichoplax adhaerens]EDV22595.1 expressed hypothetical protein [Trichoplax adhaerens]RDD42105.1 hypothetical protein TrispH2_005787 [Trichoplax sp. H2]|eukprot:XP_002115139.1 expressed hypothetical protein [Trichoplax adhaerens]
MAKTLLIITLALCVVAVNSHICLLSPRQRGSLRGINKAASDSCIRLTGPCGGQKAMKPTVTIAGGSKYTVVFQKNLNHWANGAMHGMFNISLGMVKSGKVEPHSFTHLASVPDTNTPSLWIYTQDVMIPKKSGSAVIQVIYVTDNSKAPAMFYQCSDIMIH